jgi:hypothetical protein
MALDTRKCMASIIESIELKKTVDEQIELLLDHSSYALKIVLGYGMDPGCKWLLPETDPPYTPLFEASDQEEKFYFECKKLVYFIDSDEGREVKQLRREALFIQVLESMDARDARLLLRMKNKQLKISHKAVRAAFPNMAGHWPVPNQVSGTKEAKVKK